MNPYEKTHNGGSTMVLIGCADDKYDHVDKAVNVYNGTGAITTFKSVVQNEKYDEDVDVYFFSAEHGVFPVDKTIEPYDREATEKDIARLREELANHLLDHDYEVMFNFTEGIYQRAVNEVGRSRTTEYDIDTVMLQPCCRSPAFDGLDFLRQLLTEQVEVNPAGIVDW